MTKIRTVVETPAQIDKNQTDNKLHIAYCRVSSDHKEQETSLEAQVSYYLQKIVSTPGWVSAGIFAERGSGLSLWQRVELMRMMELARNIVRKIFELRASGRSLNEISNRLYDEDIPSPTGKERWSRETISKILKNEKYTGDVMLQKTFVSDVFSGKLSGNVGQMDRYVIHEHIRQS